MSFEIPIVTKCCFCIPIRRGLIILGYLGLLCAIFSIGVASAILDHKLRLRLDADHKDIEIFDCVIFLTQFVTDFCFSIVLLVGAHRRMILPLKIYCWYSVVTIIVTVFLTFFLQPPIIEIGADYTGCIITLYLLIVIRSAYIKFGRDHPVKYSANSEEV